MLSFSLLFITHTFSQLSLHHFHLVSQSNSQSNHMSATIPDPTNKVLGAPLPPSPSHSPELGCAGAQRIMFLGRFLGYPTHLLSGGPRLARVWLIFDLARNKCLDSENQDTIDNSFWWWYPWLNGNNSQLARTPQSPPRAIIHSAGFTSITPTNLLSLE